MTFGEGIAASLTGSKNAFSRGGGRGAEMSAAELERSRRHTFQPRTSSNQGVADLINPIYNTEGARNYGNVFDQGYEALGQPLHDTNRDDVYVGGTRALASAFADRVFQQTGSLPDEDQVRQFVSQSLTPAFAQKFITGVAPDQINTMADDYLVGNPGALSNAGTKSSEEQRLMGLKEQLDKVYGAGKESLVKGYDESVYGPQKQRVANDLAAQGMLTQPTSRYALDELEANRGRDISGGLTQLEGQRAAGSIDLSKTIEDLLQRNKDRSQNAYQFGKNFNAGREDSTFNQGMQRKQLGIAELLGKQQANAGKKDWSDYLNTALGVVGTGSKAYTAFK